MEPLRKRRKLDLDSTAALESLRTKFPNKMRKLSNLTTENIKDFMDKNNVAKDNIGAEQNDGIDEINEPSKLSIFEAIIEAFCHPAVTEKVSQILTEKCIK